MRQGRVPDDRGRVAVVGAPAQDRGVPAGDRAAGEPHGQVLGHVEQPGRGGIHLRPLVAQPGRLPHRVLAGAGRHPARPGQPVPQGPSVVAPGHPQAAAGELLGVPAPRESIQVSAGCTCRPSASTATSPPHWLLMQMAVTCPYSTGCRARSRALAARIARHQSSGSCSAPPPGSSCRSTVSFSCATSSPSVLASATRGPPVPRSTPRT